MGNRCVIYARFSTDRQNERSIEDQVALCRAYAGRENLHVVDVFEDRAKSATSLFNRAGARAMLARAKLGPAAGGFDVVLVEAIDRVSRDMEDLAGLYKRLTHQGIKLRTVHEGVATTVLIGLRGLVGQLYCEDGAHKVRRGQAGRVREGLSGGGITYGYTQGPRPGERIILEPEGHVVRRIFAQFIAGRTPRQIAHDLNRDGIAAPRGPQWNASTINGSGQRGNGILRNDLYAGRLIWNKVRMVKDPDTGKRLSRPNPPTEWQIVAVPHLAIVEADTFAAAAQHKADRKDVPFMRQRAPKRLLSGLLRCAACGGGLSSKGADKTGRVRVRCSNELENGICPDPQSFYLDTIESLVLSRLRAEMKSPAVIAEYVRTYHEERKRLAAAENGKRAAAESRSGAIVREIARLVDAIAKGHGDAALLGPRASALEQERRALEAQLAAAPANVIALHPATIAAYERKLARLQQAIEADIRDGEPDHAAAIRDLVERVTVQRAGDQIRIEITGRLNALLGPKAFPGDVGGATGSGGPLQSIHPPETPMFFYLTAAA